MTTKIGTHDGAFHSDEIFAVVALRRVFEDVAIVRTRDPKALAACDILVDVGGKYDPERGRFDHHQKGGAGTHEDGTKLSSFGLVWIHYGEKICGNAAIADEIRRALVIPVDARDSGQKPERRPRDIPSIADAITTLNPAWNEAANENMNFEVALELAGLYLDRSITRAKAQLEADALVRAALAARRDPRLLVLDQGLPWQNAVAQASDLLFAILPGNRGEWILQSVPESLGAQRVRRRLPAAWGGLSGQDLARATGVADAKFAHNSGHIVVARSRAGALALAALALKQK